MNTKQEILKSWKKDSFMKTIIKVMNCVKCGKKEICQHQGFCIECMTSYSNTVEKIEQELKNSCSMCGSKTRKLVEDSGTCNSCLNGVMGYWIKTQII